MTLCPLQRGAWSGAPSRAKLALSQSVHWPRRFEDSSSLWVRCTGTDGMSNKPAGREPILACATQIKSSQRGRRPSLGPAIILPDAERCMLRMALCPLHGSAWSGAPSPTKLALPQSVHWPRRFENSSSLVFDIVNMCFGLDALALTE